MKFLVLLTLCCLMLSSKAICSSGEKEDFEQNFLIAKQHLSQRRIKQALPYLLYLQKKQPQNSNLNYLVGLCYAEAEIINPITIKLLKEASKKTSLNYDPNDLNEKRVPIYVYYYLSIAYAQNKQCEEANSAREKFLTLYPYKDKYYIEKSQDWIDYCNNLTEKPQPKALPTFPDFKPFQADKKTIYSGGGMLISSISDSSQNSIDSSGMMPNKKKAQLTTKLVDYSTNQPLYGVQLGAFQDAIPVSRFKKLKNIDAFRDHDGLIRYVIGHFSYRSQAVSLQQAIRSKGYEDAFVVNVNDAKKYKDEVISINNVNIKARQNQQVEFRIQLGAFKEELTASSAELYMRIDGIKELSDREYTYLTVGSFETYAEAKAYLKGISDTGIDDAFVIAISKGEKIPLQNAIGVHEK